MGSLLESLRSCPLVASVQADPGSPCDDPATLANLARASLGQGVRVLRLQGARNIAAVRSATGAPTIGLIKRVFGGSEVYITPTLAEVDELLALGCEVVALDGTDRPRAGGVQLPDLVARIHAAGRLAMADVDCLASARFAAEAGADWIGTTLAGYTGGRAMSAGPDLDLLREVVAAVDRPVIAEGRYTQRWQVEAALRIGATAVVVGGAINDPVKQTRALMPSAPWDGPIGAVDIGGTWLRFAVFGPDGLCQGIERTPNPRDRNDRLAWIRAKVGDSGVERLGLSTGGIVDPATGVCWMAKEYLMPDQIGIEFSERTLGVPTFAFGDGHAAAWGHACRPEFAGRRVATLALGTGLGAGFVENGRIWAGPRGEYPRFNDLPTLRGSTNEQLLGGFHLTREPSEEDRAIAVEALEGAIQAVRGLYFPDDIVVCGSVGLSPWLAPHVARLGAALSPFGSDAGIHGADALARFPSWQPGP